LISRHFVWGLDEAEKQRKRKQRFAKRNERFRDGDRNPLRSLGALNQGFRRIVCFQWLDPLFVSRESRAPNFPASEGPGRAPMSGASAALPLNSEKPYLTFAGSSRECRFSCRAPFGEASLELREE
jgi:hypothetical protein